MQQRNKFQRVQLPLQFGLNIENSVLIKNMIDLKDSPFVKKRNKFSVRTFYADDRSDFGKNKVAPHLCTTTKSNLFKRAPKLFKDKLWLIVADQIDSKDCKFCGCIWIQETCIKIEIADGPGTVRRVTNEGKIDHTYEIGYKQYTENHLLDQCLMVCRNSILKNVIFEFSYYNIPVGWKNRHFICWEITDDGTHKNRLFKEQYDGE